MAMQCGGEVVCDLRQLFNLQSQHLLPLILGVATSVSVQTKLAAWCGVGGLRKGVVYVQSAELGDHLLNLRLDRWDGSRRHGPGIPLPGGICSPLHAVCQQSAVTHSLDDHWSRTVPRNWSLGLTPWSVFPAPATAHHTRTSTAPNDEGAPGRKNPQGSSSSHTNWYAYAHDRMKMKNMTHDVEDFWQEKSIHSQ
jgi:hypothetical protein